MNLQRVAMIDNKHKQHLSRRDFFSYLVSLLSVPFIFWWIFTGSRERALSAGTKNIIIGRDIPMGISLQQGLVLVREQNLIRAYEARCTHLGCAIRKVEGNELVCQCHGSRFDMSGNAVTGPAIKPLKELAVQRNASTGELTIQMKR